MKIITADYVLPISSEPILKGAVAFENGTIEAVGDAASILKLFPSADVEHFGRAAALPGFVNCHSHLELTSMRGALDDVEHDFRSWLLKVNELRSEMSETDIEAAVLAGVREGAAAGVTCFADVGRYGRAGVLALQRTGLRGIVFQETEFSPDNRTADDDFARLGAKYEELRREETDLVNKLSARLSPDALSRRFQTAAFPRANNGPFFRKTVPTAPFLRIGPCRNRPRAPFLRGCGSGPQGILGGGT